MKKISLLLLVSVLFLSCKEHVLSDSFIYFNEAQPTNVDAITSIPQKYRGTYSMNDSREMNIQSKTIVVTQIDTIKATRSELDSIPGIQFKNNQVYDTDRKIYYATLVKNDSITWKMTSSDTIFSFAENEVAKIYKSSLILNKQINGNEQVNVLKFNGNGLTEIQLGTKNDANVIQNRLHISREIIIQNSDTTRIILKPTRADFRKLLRLEDFEYQNKYRLK